MFLFKELAATLGLQLNTTPSEGELRKMLSDYSHAIYIAKLATGPGGTLSARLNRGRTILVKPSGFNLGELKPEDFVEVELETLRVVKGVLKPSMEVGVLASCHLARDDVNAVIHAHPPFCIALTTVGLNLNTPLYPDHAVFLEKVANLPFYPPGSEELAEAAGEAAKTHDCMLLKNHGVITLGSSLREAYYRLEIMEESAKITVLSSILAGLLKPGGKPESLSTEQAEAIRRLQAEAYRRNLAKNW
ncbi:MAG: class II aldolase/adducin family protein [Crenarchaeota archaeon]|nr:class II aldolase/adducin family protein [Thermoproteota archaeon]